MTIETNMSNRWRTLDDLMIVKNDKGEARRVIEVRENGVKVYPDYGEYARIYYSSSSFDVHKLASASSSVFNVEGGTYGLINPPVHIDKEVKVIESFYGSGNYSDADKGFVRIEIKSSVSLGELETATQVRESMSGGRVYDIDRDSLERYRDFMTVDVGIEYRREKANSAYVGRVLYGDYDISQFYTVTLYMPFIWISPREGNAGFVATRNGSQVLLSVRNYGNYYSTQMAPDRSYEISSNGLKYSTYSDYPYRLYSKPEVYGNLDEPVPLPHD